jgi:alkanesulfonate monooxygenase SsuD/methylene tetrahydromethanopterin reductase-like flavin-dependent oxidoreductase (luciferase family)
MFLPSLADPIPSLSAKYAHTEEVIMRYGLNLPNGGACADAHTLAELAHDAEEAGWDGVFLEDYIVYQGAPGTPTCDPWVALAAMAVLAT